MERRVSVLGALVLGFLVCPATARADCHEGKRPCRRFVEAYKAAWGNAEKVNELFAPSADVTIDGVRATDTKAAVTVDQAMFANTAYAPVIVSASHVVLGYDDYGKKLLADNLANITWTGAISCRGGTSCESTKIKTGEVVKAVLVRVSTYPETWKILNLNTTREPSTRPEH